MLTCSLIYSQRSTCALWPATIALSSLPLCAVLSLENVLKVFYVFIFFFRRNGIALRNCNLQTGLYVLQALSIHFTLLNVMKGGNQAK